MGKVIILPETTKNPISLIGERAGVCWGADITDAEKNYKRGLDCIESGHGRTLEYVNIEAVLDGYSARVIREWYTHIGGAPTRLQASTRYIDYGDFEYITPYTIKSDVRAWERYDCIMKEIRQAAKGLEELDIPREDIANILPLGMTTRIVDKRNLRNVIDMSRQRECMRAYWEFREMFSAYSNGLIAYGHEHGSMEWELVVRKWFRAKCDVLHGCPESRGCGKWPSLAR